MFNAISFPHQIHRDTSLKPHDIPGQPLLSSQLQLLYLCCNSSYPNEDCGLHHGSIVAGRYREKGKLPSFPRLAGSTCCSEKTPGMPWTERGSASKFETMISKVLLPGRTVHSSSALFHPSRQQSMWLATGIKVLLAVEALRGKFSQIMRSESSSSSPPSSGR